MRIAALALVSLVLTLPIHGSVTIVGSGNLAVTVDPGGSYSVTVPDLAWTFGGSIGAPLNNLRTLTGADTQGFYLSLIHI